jgi:hypothetical protein
MSLAFSRRAAIALAAGSPWLFTRDDAFLEDLSHRCFRLLWEQADPETGLVADRARTDGKREPRAANIASIASTGFALTGLCIAAERKWIPPAQAAGRVRTTLRAFDTKIENQHGWFYHFLDATSGARAWKCELSSIDTALLLAGVLTTRQYFQEDSEISRLAGRIYERIDFQWMLNGSPNLLSHGWKPETGFLPHRWDRYSEGILIYLLAIGSPTHSIPADSWYAWERTKVTYAGMTFMSDAPLFTHQYPQAWFDLRGLRDAAPSNVDYFENSIRATKANRAFCISLAKEFPKSYSEEIWGISASDGEHGYYAWGNPPKRDGIDGTVVPCAAGGSLMFQPDLCESTLAAMKTHFGDRLWGVYGFADAFNPTTGWVDPDVLGIDQGMTLLSAENIRTGNVWKWFMRNSEAALALRLAGFSRF